MGVAPIGKRPKELRDFRVFMGVGQGHFVKRKRILLSPQFRSLPSGDPKCNPDRKEERSFGRWFGRGEGGRKDSDFGPSGQGWAPIPPFLCGGFANAKRGHRVTHSTNEILFECFQLPNKNRLCSMTCGIDKNKNIKI